MRLSTLFILPIVLFSCDFGDTNIDVSRPSEVTSDLLLPITLTQAAYTQSGVPARMSSVFMQYLTGFDAKLVAYQDYTFDRSTFDNLWQTGIYAGVLKDAEVLIEQARREGENHYQAIGHVIQAMWFAETASMFGDIPYSEALRGPEILQPAYDTQMAVYAGVQMQLDTAIQLLNEPVRGLTPGADDLIFGGDASAWTETAYALKARYLMHTAAVEPENFQKVLDILQNDAFQSADREPGFAFGISQTSNNPYAKFGSERPNTMIVEDPTDTDPIAKFATRLLERDDPRFSRYTTLDANANYYLFFDPSNLDLRWSKDNSVIPYISHSELKFMEAEAQFQLGDNSAATATLKEALRASMELNNVELTTEVEAWIEDRIGSDTDLLEIIEEAYFAYYGVAPLQTWTNYKRTGFPLLPLNPDANLTNSPSGRIPVRFFYPSVEISRNNANVSAAIERQGGDLLDVRTAAFGG